MLNLESRIRTEGRQALKQNSNLINQEEFASGFKETRLKGGRIWKRVKDLRCFNMVFAQAGQ